MKNLIMQLKRNWSKQYMSWSEYQDKVEFMSQLKWQQDVRKQSVKNSAAPGGFNSEVML